MSTPEIEHAAEILRAGGLVAFPTETVYGLGADASNHAAIEKVFRVKGRPTSHPLIVHIADAAQLEEWAEAVPDVARLLIASFWPGPLTLVFRKREGVLDAVTGGQPTVAIRVPAHPLAHALLVEFGGGVVAPSANRFGRISPTTAEHVRVDLGPEVDLVLDDGGCEIGIESTIVDVSRERPVLLRPGKVRAEDIERVLGEAPSAADEHAPRAPGSHAAHYAPRAALKLVTRREFTDELPRHRGQRIAALTLEVSVPRVPKDLQRALPASAALYARSLYAKLRELDALDVDLILVERPPTGASWEAIWDRLRRAEHAHASGVRAARKAKTVETHKSLTTAEADDSEERHHRGSTASPDR